MRQMRQMRQMRHRETDGVSSDDTLDELIARARRDLAETGTLADVTWCRLIFHMDGLTDQQLAL